MTTTHAGPELSQQNDLKLFARQKGELKPVKSVKMTNGNEKARHQQWRPNAFFGFIHRHQFDLPIICILAVFLPSLLPQLFSPSVTRFVQTFSHLSGAKHMPPTNEQLYAKDINDFRFTFFYTIVFIFLRACFTAYIAHPIARTRLPAYRVSLITRFGEQAWLSLYYSTSFTFGLYLAYNSPHWFSTAHFWIDYPHVNITAPFKSYYLLQLAFCIALLITLHTEKPRKDYLQFLVHHFVTIALVSTSYYGNFTRIGNAVFLTMDVADIFLPTAKCLKYLRFRKSCDFMFILFVIAWVASRHIAFLYVVSSLFVDVTSDLLKWDPENEHYFSPTTYTIYLMLFAGLKVLILYWGWLIFKVVMKVLKGKGAEDSRSDNEDSDIEVDGSVGVENSTSFSSRNVHVKPKFQ